MDSGHGLPVFCRGKHAATALPVIGRFKLHMRSDRSEAVLGVHIEVFACAWRSPTVSVNANLVGGGDTIVSP